MYKDPKIKLIFVIGLYVLCVDNKFVLYWAQEQHFELSLNVMTTKVARWTCTQLEQN